MSAASMTPPLNLTPSTEVPVTIGCVVCVVGSLGSLDAEVLAPQSIAAIILDTMKKVGVIASLRAGYLCAGYTNFSKMTPLPPLISNQVPGCLDSPRSLCVNGMVRGMVKEFHSIDIDM